MTTRLHLIAAVLAMAFLPSYAQDDSTRYIFGIPVSDDDTVGNFPQRDRKPVNDLRAMTVRELPRELREALDEGPQYKGWRDTIVWYQQNTERYIVPVEYEEGIKIFGLDKEGNPRSYSEVSDPDVQQTGDHGEDP